MSKITLVTGGSRSGKSSFGENLLKGKDKVLYIATSIITDEDMKERIAIHKARRNENWQTFEGYKDLHKIIEKTECTHIMLECVTTMITNLMFDKYTDFDNISKKEIQLLENNISEEIKKAISACRKADKELIVITNEVGFSLVSEYRLGRIFTDISGRINQMLGKLCDEAYLVVAGLPLKLK
ncbi:bifunctional adenosylcobinamide kinase/adenosylcobinamide-phosphate guanylyltransferase [Clostridium sp. 19966]|uniref:bifunctional adenosylcobinamide kinase/adenosylcobinamide-phosphate guanylyltransferase n=1 Tax=Clostridium sp. 19966 TaxID=2768166 RepID=UPI0028DE0A95|nr:bifunctional adenosylcobinamide kinase/adenosylcobinamide-phosphate guanylyltransferase [Clostridium sp. 19966]MDT8717352.1 bifunctional adenosylcobinamide kinase/adenosylcobinamide-phosphate guanylyltransferase [Clostridium sp. 19966]